MKIVYLFAVAIFSFGLLQVEAADKTRIAVMGLDAKNGVDANTAGTISDLLGSELVSLKKFDVVDRANMDKIMKEQALQQGGCSDQACAVKLGNILNVQKMVVGSVSKLGSKYIITVNFVDVERSKVELSDKVTADNDDDLLNKVQVLAQNINGQVGINGRVVTLKENGNALINIGKDDGVKVGQQVSIVRFGNAIVDQTTGDFLGREVTEVGKARIVSVDAGGLLSIVSPQGNAQPFKQGDRVTIEASGAVIVPDRPAPRNNNPPPVVRKEAPVSSPASSSAVSPLLPIGLVLTAIGGGGVIYSFVAADYANNNPAGAYKKYTTFDPSVNTSGTAAQLWTNYQSEISTFNTIRIISFGVLGAGVVSTVLGLIIKPNPTAYLVPEIGPERLALTYYRKF
jgi:TolB-like protein